MWSYPSLPEDTRRAANALYGNGHIYIRLGNRLDELVADLPLAGMTTLGVKSWLAETTLQCALMTIFQYIEMLANQPMLEAVRQRVDLRYALHLPINSLSLEPQDLCDFRKKLFSDPTSLQSFQNLVNRLNEFGWFALAHRGDVDASQLLTSVCTMNRFDETLEAMYRALETLAVTNPEWLRRIAIPYWYDRYNRQRKSSPLPITDPKWNSRVIQVGVDIRYLLGEIDKSNQASLASLKEIKEIRRIWNEQFMLAPAEKDAHQSVRWGLTRCASCQMLSEEIPQTNHQSV